MKQDNPEESRRTLYDRFYNIVGRAGASSRLADDAYFDEDDIIEIYDYANDINDDFIKMEALFYGARMFPDSEALRTRRDYLYYYLGNDNAVRVLLERRKSPTTLSRLLSLRARSDRGENTADELESILADARSFDDEEVIQFVSEASTPANYDWLKANVDKIKAKCSYLPVLYYELAGAAEENLDYPTAVAMAEELTMLEPFNLEYWELLAEIQRASGDEKGCLVTLDFSMAIDPSSVKSKMLRAAALFSLDHSSREALDLFMGLKDSEQFDAMSMQSLAVLLTNFRRNDEAVAALESFLDKHPGEIVTLDCLFILNEKQLSEYIGLIRADNSFDDLSTDFWVDWASRHMVGDRFNVAAEILLEAMRRGKLQKCEYLLLEALYRAGRYDDVMILYNELGAGVLVNSPEVTAAAVMALARMNRIDSALDIAAQFLNRMASLNVCGPSESPVPAKATRTFYAVGVKQTFHNMVRALGSPDLIPPDDYDPFIDHDIK